MITTIDFGPYAAAIARALYGQPNEALSTDAQLRYGTNGSLAIGIAGEGAGTWYDHEAGEGGGMLDLVNRKRGIGSNGEAMDWLRQEGLIPAAAGSSPRPRLKLVRAHVYHDEAGEPLFRVTRWEPKTFTQQRWDAAAGKFVGGKGCMKGVRRVPYRLPELLAAERVFIVEGEKDADSLAALGLAATTNPGGGAKAGKTGTRPTKKWPPGFSSLFAGRDVVILPDNDQTGRDHVRTIARSLVPVAASVRILELPDLPEKGDVSDWLAAGGTAAQLLELANALDPLTQEDLPAAPEPESLAGERIEIKLSEAHMNSILRRCAGLLHEKIYMRGPFPRVLARAETAGGCPVEDRDGAAVEIAGVRHRPGSLLFIDATPEIVAWHLDERVLFWKFDKRSCQWLPASCTSKVAQRAVGAATELGFRSCSGFVQVPLFINGEVVTAPGWHQPTGLILDLSCDLPALPAKPTKEDAARALEILLRPFRGYTHDAPTLRPAIAAAALTAVLRPSLRAVPAILIDGNTIGAGKGKLARALSVLATGDAPAIITEGHNEEETEKRIASVVLQGSPAVLLDNLQRTVASSTLESILTESVAEIRIFGKLDGVKVACRALVMMTANNANLRRDMLRRTLPVRIVVPDEKPELRRFGFDPVDEAWRDRAELLAAVFTIAKAWHQARHLAENASILHKTLGSFEVWAALIAGAVEWLTGTSPIDIVEARKDEDPAAACERTVITRLAETFRDAEFTAAEAAAQIEPAIWREVMRFKTEAPEGRAVGNWLKYRKDRAFSVHPEGEDHPVPVALVSSKPDWRGVVRWRVQGAGSHGSHGSTRVSSTTPRESGNGAEGGVYAYDSLRVAGGTDPCRPVRPVVSEPDGTTASVPLMITEAMKAELRARGYRDTFIRTLKPAEAWNILQTGARPQQYGGGAS